jgi:hypothetical protein
MTDEDICLSLRHKALLSVKDGCMGLIFAYIMHVARLAVGIVHAGDAMLAARKWRP